MREPTVARNYAEVLVSLAQEAKDLDGFGAAMDMVADVCGRDARLKQFLETPSVTAKEKSRIIGKAFDGKLPQKLVRFVQAMVRNRRQHLLSEVALEYHSQVDALTGRAHAQVQVVSEPSEAVRASIAKELSRITGLRVVPHFTVRPHILGGVVVRMGDTVMDGSLARRLASLRTRMLGTAAR
jgi:F-type H+-transporting ATPase subunit delta